MNTALKVQDMTDDEIISLVEMCSYMFGVHRISDEAITSFCYMLKAKFPLMRGEKIIQLCTDVAANPPKADIKFTPSFMASILKSSQKEFRPLGYIEREISVTEKMKYRQEFLKDLYADFDLRKHGEETKNIIVWEYVARCLVKAGYAERLPAIDEKRIKEAERFTNLQDAFNFHKPFVIECFDKMIKNNQHISEVIHGIN